MFDFPDAADDFGQPVLDLLEEVVVFGRELGHESDGPVDGAEEDAALRSHRGLAQVLHDEGAVAEDVDELAQMEKGDFLQVLAVFVGGGGRVLLTGEEIVRVFSADESVVV